MFIHRTANVINMKMFFSIHFIPLLMKSNTMLQNNYTGISAVFKRNRVYSDYTEILTLCMRFFTVNDVRFVIFSRLSTLHSVSVDEIPTEKKTVLDSMHVSRSSHFAILSREVAFAYLFRRNACSAVFCHYTNK